MLITGFPIGHALRQWSDKYSRAMSQLKNVEAPRRLAHWMRQAGFTDVEERSRYLKAHPPPRFIPPAPDHWFNLTVTPFNQRLVPSSMKQHVLIFVW